MALTWENLKAFGNVVKKATVPVAADCVYDEITIWINTVTDIGYLINGATITPLPVTVGSEVPVSSSVLDDYMKKSVYDTDDNNIADEAETIDGGSF